MGNFCRRRRFHPNGPVLAMNAQKFIVKLAYFCAFQNSNFNPDCDCTETVRAALRRASSPRWQDITLTEEVEDQDEEVKKSAVPQRASSMAVLRSPHWIRAKDLRGAVPRSVPNPRFTAEVGIEATPSLHGSPVEMPFRTSPPPTPESKNTTPSQ